MENPSPLPRIGRLGSSHATRAGLLAIRVRAAGTAHRQAVNYIVRVAGENAKLGRVWPHMLRHDHAGLSGAPRIRLGAVMRQGVIYGGGTVPPPASRLNDRNSTSVIADQS